MKQPSEVACNKAKAKLAAGVEEHRRNITEHFNAFKQTEERKENYISQTLKVFCLSYFFLLRTNF